MKKKVRTVSVVTVCLNCADSIELTLQSVREQTRCKVEHIVIDGGSSDGTVPLIRKFRVAHFVSEPDEGIYHAMEKGVAAATADVVIFLNSGDVFHDQHVCEEVVAYFNLTGSDVLFGDFTPYLVHQDDRYDHPSFIPDRICKLEGVVNRSCLYHQNIHHQSLFYRREIFDHCSFFSAECPGGSDYELNVSALVKHAHPASYFPRVVTKFALGGASTADYQQEHQQFLRLRDVLRAKYFAEPVTVPPIEYLRLYAPPRPVARRLTRLAEKLSLWRPGQSAFRSLARALAGTRNETCGKALRRCRLPYPAEWINYRTRSINNNRCLVTWPVIFNGVATSWTPLWERYWTQHSAWQTSVTCGGAATA